MDTKTKSPSPLKKAEPITLTNSAQKSLLGRQIKQIQGNGLVLDDGTILYMDNIEVATMNLTYPDKEIVKKKL